MAAVQAIVTAVLALISNPLLEIRGVERVHRAMVTLVLPVITPVQVAVAAAAGREIAF